MVSNDVNSVSQRGFSAGFNDQSLSLPTQTAARDFTRMSQLGAPESKDFADGILALVQQLLAKLQKGPTKPEPSALLLSESQQNNLRSVLGFSDSSAVQVEVLDRNKNGKLNAGDIAVVSGGITGGEIARHVLTPNDIDRINGKANLPSEFLAQRALWEAASQTGQDVSYTAQASCFCPPDYTRPMDITEQNGRIVSANYADDGSAVPDYIRDGLLTIDERFAQLEEAYAAGAASVNVSYDAELGYPSSVFIDQSTQIADEEISYSISQLAIGS